MLRSKISLASATRRGLVFLIDLVLLSLVLYLLAKFSSINKYALATLPFIYYFFSELIFLRTLGKLLTRTKVSTEEGQRPSVWRILARTILRIALPFDAAFILFGRPTVLHDLGSDTVVKRA